MSIMCYVFCVVHLCGDCVCRGHVGVNEGIIKVLFCTDMTVFGHGAYTGVGAASSNGNTNNNDVRLLIVVI